MTSATKTGAKLMGKAKGAAKLLAGYPAIFRHLSEEHAEVSALMERVAKAPSDSDAREQLFPEIRRSLLAHARAEEQEFYEPLRRFGDTAARVPRAIEEHRRIEEQLETLAAASFSDPRWLADFERLKAAVAAHVESEESELFPAAKPLLDDEQAREIDERYRAAEEREKEPL